MKQILTTLAVNWLCKQLEKDKDYYIGWKSSIAMSFQDSYYWAEDKEAIHKISNEAADNFLKILINK
jgi:hypothetical protein